MSRLHEKAQAQVKQMVGQMIGDDRLVVEGREQQHRAEHPQEVKADQDDPNQEHKAPSSSKNIRATEKRERQAPE